MENNFVMPVYEKVLAESAEKEFENDFSLPEYCPNILRIARLCTNATVKKCSVEQGAVFADIEVEYTLVYLSEYRNLIKSAKFTTNVSHTFPCKSFPEDEEILPRIRVNVIASNVKNAGQRHLCIKTRLALFADAQRTQNLLLCPKDEIEDAEFKTGTLSVCERRIMPETEINIRHSVRIEDGMPNIAEIVCCEIDPCITDIAYSEGKLKIYGAAKLFVLYQAQNEGNDEDAQYICLSKNLPIDAELEAENMQGYEFLAQICSPVVSALVATDSYGEARQIDADITADLDIFAYRNTQCAFCEDAFYKKSSSNTLQESASYESFVKIHKETLPFEASVKADTRNLNNTLDTRVQIVSLQNESANGKLYVSGRANLYLLGENSEGNLDSAVGVFSFKLPLNLPLAQKERYSSFCDIGSCVGRIENGEIKLSCEMKVSCVVTKKAEVLYVTALEEGAQTQERKGNFTVYYPNKNDTVWTVAKRYGVSPEKIREDNSVLGESLSGKRIIVIQ